MSAASSPPVRTVEGRTVCVTGASSGIGRSIAEHLGGLGAHVFMMGRSEGTMAESAARIAEAGGRAEIDTFDVGDSDALRAWIDGAASSTGRLDVMVNNAGFGDMAGILDGDPAMWKAMLDVNVLALAVGCQAAVAAMRATGSEGNIVNISSAAATRRDSSFYGATKHAVNCITSTLREELQDDPIRVTSLMPGVFATNFTRNVDRELVQGLAGAAGIEHLEFDADGKLPQHQIAQVHEAMPSMIGDVEHLARAVEYVITLPIEVGVDELLIRPGKSLPI